ncbi:type II secretion system protein [Pelagicoccus albus]|uniref:Type II secretion system protein n=1 Tax=Pelagicoccus albus TaxID=415222 RepID=A0A7X1B314_9BACT|nr:type II secretion system protein [Pelagicoccus albus]MBC2604662.1 type II secretion system protein [Pelagicoccus albus]
MRFKRKGKFSAAFTLVEVMVTLTVSGIVLGASMTFLVSASNFAAYNEGKLLVNKDIRKFTSQLSDYATYSNLFVIYKSFTDRTVVDDGGSGDFLVLGFVDENDPNLYTQIIGFYRSATTDEEGPVRKFSISYNTPQDSLIADLLPAESTFSDHEEIVELSRGLSDGHLFHNYFGRSVTVQGQILHQGSTLNRATNTYNFTISPRG